MSNHGTLSYDVCLPQKRTFLRTRFGIHGTNPIVQNGGDLRLQMDIRFSEYSEVLTSKKSGLEPF